ncbi:MAG TPA: hypothetical protein VF458_20380 [Ktedonobacteraceae bacterium]
MTTSTIQQQRARETAQAAASITSLDRRTVAAHIGPMHLHHTFAWASHQAIAESTSATIVMSLCADLPALHQSALEIADEVLVLNLAGHIDARTLHELCAAYNQRKPITWLEDWSMDCPRCQTIGPEAEHFFHNTLSLGDLNELLATFTAEQLEWLEDRLLLADWYGQLVPVVLLPDGLPALRVDLTCTHCNHFARTAYAIAGENGAWITLLDADGAFLADLCDADRRVQVLSCPDIALQAPIVAAAPTMPVPCHLTVEDVLERSVFQPAIKTALTQIRELTEQDVIMLGATFRDLENRVQRVEVGRYLCVGSQGERWTCSANSMQQRVSVSEPDADGFRWYRQRDPKPVLVTVLTEPFVLETHGETWTSQEDGGVITWNGEIGDALQMRVITRAIFAETYQMLEAEVRDGE